MAMTEEVVIVTTNIVPGKEITRTFGIIEARCGRLVRSEEGSAKENLIKKAREKGANAIVGYSYARRWARGTAVFVE